MVAESGEPTAGTAALAYLKKWAVVAHTAVFVNGLTIESAR